MTTLLSLSQHAKHKDGTYVAFELSKQSQDQLSEFVKEHLLIENSGVDPKTYHTTVIYSRTPVAYTEHLLREIDTTATCSGYDIFGHDKTENSLVILIDCPLARKLNDALTKMGASSDYPVYRAHVTIARNYDGQVVNLPPHSLRYTLIMLLLMDWMKQNELWKAMILKTIAVFFAALYLFILLFMMLFIGLMAQGAFLLLLK